MDATNDELRRRVDRLEGIENQRAAALDQKQARADVRDALVSFAAIGAIAIGGVCWFLIR